MDCEGRRGILNYTCPVYYPVSSCTYWDTKTLSWSDEGCKYWKTDDVNGVAYCNCTHLTAFTSDVQSELQSSSSFADTTRSAEDLTGQDIIQNIGIIVTLLVIWSATALLYTYDKGRRQFELMNLHLNEESYARYISFSRSMFSPVSTHPTSSFAHELQPVHRAAWETFDENQKEEELIHVQQVLKFMSIKSSVLANWVDKLRTDNDFIALLNPESYRRELFTKRSIFFLVNILSLMFVAAVYTPLSADQGFICPGVKTQGIGNAGLLPFPPDLAGFDLIVWFVTNELWGGISNVIWLTPAGWLIYALYVVGGDLHKTRAIHEERLHEIKRHDFLLDPTALAEIEDTMVCENLLRAAHFSLSRLSMIIGWRKKYLEWPDWAQRVLAAWFGLAIPQHALLEEHWDEVNANLLIVSDAIDQAVGHIEFLENEEEHVRRTPAAVAPAWRRRGAAPTIVARERDIDDLSTISSSVHALSVFSGARSVRTTAGSARIPERAPLHASPSLLAHCWRAVRGESRRQRVRTRRRKAAQATLPRAVQMEVERREALLNSLDGGEIRGMMVPTLLQPCVIWLKRVAFNSFAGESDPSTGTKKPIAQLLRQQRYASIVGSFYLAFVTLFIFLTAIRVSDNDTIRMILLTTFVSEGISIGIVQPIEFLLVSGFVPAIAVVCTWRDVEQHIQKQDERSAALRRLEQMNRAPVNDMNGPFERAAEWSRVEALFGVADALRLMNLLQERDIFTMQELQMSFDVSRELLIDSMKYGEQEVEEFWNIVYYGFAKTDQVSGGEAPEATVDKSGWSILSWMKRPRNDGGELSRSSRSASKVGAVMPVLSDEDDDDASACSSITAYDEMPETRISKTTKPEEEDKRPWPIEEDYAEDDNDAAVAADDDDDDDDDDDNKDDLRMQNQQLQGAEVFPMISAAPDGLENHVSVEEWLDSLEDGYGRAYGYIFTDIGCWTIGDIGRLTIDEVRTISSVLGEFEKIPRRKIRSAMRSKVYIDEALDKRSDEDSMLDSTLASFSPSLSVDHRSAVSFADDQHSSEGWEEEKESERWEQHDAADDDDGSLSVDDRSGEGSVGRSSAGSRSSVHGMRRAEESDRMPPIEEHYAEDDELQGSGEVVPAVSAPALDAEAEVSVEEWLDSLISGYGKSYGYVFTEVGCRTVSDLDRLDATQLQALQLLIKASSMEKSARRYIRAALRAHLDDVLEKASISQTTRTEVQPLSVDVAPENPAAPDDPVGEVISLEEWFDSATSGYGDGEDYDEADMHSQTATLEFVHQDDFSLDQWLDRIEAGFGAKYGYIFEKLGLSTLVDLSRLGLEHMETLQATLKSSNLEKKVRRRIRKALRDHFDQVHHDESFPDHLSYHDAGAEWHV